MLFEAAGAFCRAEVQVNTGGIGLDRGVSKGDGDRRTEVSELFGLYNVEVALRRMHRLTFEERRGGGGLGPKICVPKMVRQDFPNGKFRFFPRRSLWSGGAGGGHLLRLSTVLMQGCARSYAAQACWQDQPNGGSSGGMLGGSGSRPPLHFMTSLCPTRSNIPHSASTSQSTRYGPSQTARSRHPHSGPTYSPGHTNSGPSFKARRHQILRSFAYQPLPEAPEDEFSAMAFSPHHR